ncbi:MAG: hypothetical protein EHM44_05895, partial [Ignavibacteriales bacterium]
ANLTGNEKSTALGFGFKVGYQGKLLEELSFGASYQSKVYMSEFERYAGLFAQAGDFDVPANWQAGFAFTPGAWKFMFDVKQIFYSQVKSIANPMLPNLQTALLGQEEGAGFGWKDILVIKYGVMFSGFCGWDFMAGYSVSQNPINEENVMFNILAPAVIQNHVTFGISKDIAKNHEVTVAFMFALENNIIGPNPLNGTPQTIELGMKQWQVEVGYTFSSF